MIERLGHSRRQVLHYGLSACGIVLLAGLLAYLPLTYAVALVGASIAAVLALIHPSWAVVWAILSVPIQDLVRLPGGLTVTQITMLLAVGSWMLYTLARPQELVRWGPLGLPLLAVSAAMALSTLATPYSASDGLKEILRWLWVAMAYLIVLNTVRTSQQSALILLALCIAPALVAVYGLWQFVTASGPPSFGVAGGRFVRAYGTIGQPNSFAGYMNMAWSLCLVLGLSFFWRSWHRGLPFGRFVPLVAAGAAGLTLAALAASFSRGGWIGAVGGVLALGAAWLFTGYDPRQRRALLERMLGAALLGGLLLVVLVMLYNTGALPASVANRLDSIFTNLRLFDVRTVDVTPANFSVVERMAQMQAGWGMFNSNPLVGIGPGNYSNAYSDFYIPPWSISQGHAHNYYLHSAAEGGLLGLLAYLFLLGMLIRLCLQALRRAEQPWERLVALGACGMMGAVMTHNLFENLHVLNLPIHMGAIWGLLAWIGRDRTLEAGDKQGLA
jgi:O-antigen ligase